MDPLGWGDCFYPVPYCTEENAEGGHRSGEVYDDVEVENRDLDEEKHDQVHSYCPGDFPRVIEDEMPSLKSQATVIHMSVKELQAVYHIGTQRI